jgi:hypothetical protein
MQVKPESPLSRRQAALQTPLGRRAEQVKKSHPLAVRACRCNPWLAAVTPDGAAVNERTMDVRDRCCKCSRRARRIRNGHPTLRSSCFSSRRQRQLPSRACSARARTRAQAAMHARRTVLRHAVLRCNVMQQVGDMPGTMLAQMCPLRRRRSSPRQRSGGSRRSESSMTPPS